MADTIVRDLQKSDFDDVALIAKEVGLFTPEQLEMFVGMIELHLGGETDEEGHWAVVTEGGQVLGAAYYAPE